MDILLPILFFIIGLGLLAKASDWLVEGASAIANKFKIPPIVIGLTIVSLGTSAPELFVSLNAAFNGKTDIALGNVVGSNIFNILAILGISALIYPIAVRSKTLWTEIPISLVAAIIIPTVALIAGVINGVDLASVSLLNNSEVIGTVTRWGGLCLLAVFAFFMVYIFRTSKDELQDEVDTEAKEPMWQSAIFVLLGLVGLAVGSELAVNNAVEIGRIAGLTEKVISVTIIAMGTGFPELFTSVNAALKKNTDIAVGNVMGSNIMNIALILGLTSFITPVNVVGVQLLDTLILIAVTLFLMILTILPNHRKLGKVEGSLMIAAYLGYTAFLLIAR